MKNLHKLYLDIALLMLSFFNLGLYPILAIETTSYHWLLNILLILFYIERVVDRIKNKDY